MLLCCILRLHITSESGAILVDTAKYILLSQGTHSVDHFPLYFVIAYIDHDHRISDSFKLPLLNSATTEIYLCTCLKTQPTKMTVIANYLIMASICLEHRVNKLLIMLIQGVISFVFLMLFI